MNNIERFHLAILHAITSALEEQRLFIDEHSFAFARAVRKCRAVNPQAVRWFIKALAVRQPLQMQLGDELFMYSFLVSIVDGEFVVFFKARVPGYKVGQSARSLKEGVETQ